ncbi:GntR family transcriptional regulator [Verticiella sediminum]
MPQRARPVASGSRAANRPRTVPEQIADEFGARVIEGTVVAGHRITEQEVALRFGVSRAPAREALRLLERRGLIEILPRRGTYVRAVSTNAIAELFNVRIALAGYAARAMAQARPDGHVGALEHRLADMRAMARRSDADPREFARAYSRAIGSIAKGSGNDALAAVMRDLANHTAWTTVWRHTLDFATPRRRDAVCRRIGRVVQAIAAGDGEGAESELRVALEDTRDTALGALTQLRGDALDERHRVRTQATDSDPRHDHKEETRHELAGRNRRPGKAPPTGP